MEKVFEFVSTTRQWFVLVLFVALVGCQSTGDTLPSWVSNPTIDNYHYYAVGEGVSLREAQLNAKESLASQLLSHVSSEVKTMEVTDEDFHRLYVEKSSNAHFKDIALPNLTTIQQAKVGLNHYVQVKLKKTDLTEYLMKELAAMNPRLSNTIKSGRNTGNAFDYWWILHSQAELANRLSDNWLLASATAENKNNETIIESQQLLTRYDNALDRVKKTLKLKIDDNTPIRGLTALTQQQLTAANIDVVKSKRRSKYSEIEFNSNVKRKKLQGDYHSEVTLVVLLKKASGAILASRQLTESAVSISSYKDAEKKANEKLLKSLSDSNVTVIFTKRQS